MLVLENVGYAVGGHTFGPFHCSVNNGDTVAIIGPSGAGKSTLLRLIAADIAPSHGSIYWKDKALQQYSLPDLAIERAVLPQQHHVAFHLSPRLVIGLGRIARTTDTDLDAIITAAAQAACADHLLTASYHTLSGGEQARIQLARVFAQLWDTQQGLLLIDEPLAALDPGLQASLLRTIVEFAKARQHTVIAIVHDLHHALHGFQRLFFIKNQQLIKDIPSTTATITDFTELYDTPFFETAGPNGQRVVVPCLSLSPALT